MNLLKLFSTTLVPTELSQGRAINGYLSVLWVERYQKEGEFKIKALLSSGLMELLPIGTFVSHTDTQEVMMVENHEIEQPLDEDPVIEISGRSFVGYLENRYVGDGHATTTNTLAEYVLASDETWNQIEALIFDHIVTSVESDDNLPGVYVSNSCSGSGTSAERVLAKNDILQTVMELLKIDDIGIRTIRPTPTDADMYLDIYQGTDVSNIVRFSWTGGDLENVKYLFSNKKLKNRAHVVGRWVQAIFGDTETGFDRRTMLIDGSDLDGQLSAMPTGGTLITIVSKMGTRAAAALASQTNVSITQVDISVNAQWRYRTDYNIGDLVTVDGDFGASATMRVVEFAETEDENGMSGMPTLAIPGENS